MTFHVLSLVVLFLSLIQNYLDPSKRPSFAEVVVTLKEIMAKYCPDQVDYDKDIGAEASDKSRVEASQGSQIKQPVLRKNRKPSLSIMPPQTTKTGNYSLSERKLMLDQLRRMSHNRALDGVLNTESSVAKTEEKKGTLQEECEEKPSQLADTNRSEKERDDSLPAAPPKTDNQAADIAVLPALIAEDEEDAKRREKEYRKQRVEEIRQKMMQRTMQKKLV